MKKIIGALVLGAAIALPAVTPDYAPDNIASVACAKAKRVTVYTKESIDDQGYPQYEHYELEPDSFGEMELNGVHYMSFWVAEIGEYFNNFWYDKANWGSHHFLFKFYPDGSYRTRNYYYDKSKAKHKERIDLAGNWETALKYWSQKEGKDYFDPSNWGLDDVDHAMAKYIKANYPALVQQNIAYDTNDKAVLMQREAAAKQAAEEAAKQRYNAIQRKMEASAAPLRNEGFIKVAVNETSYSVYSLGNPLVYKDVVAYSDWYIDPANIHYSVGTDQWAGTERYDVLVASVGQDGKVEKEWFVYLHDPEGNWANFQLGINDSPLGRSFSDVGSYGIINFGLEPGQEALDRFGIKHGAISAIMQAVLNYRNGADMTIIHTDSTAITETLEAAEFNALPFPTQKKYVEEF